MGRCQELMIDGGREVYGKKFKALVTGICDRNNMLVD